MANDKTAYVRMRRGGYQEVENWDNVLYAEQDVYSGWYRDTGWILNQLPDYTIVEFPSGSGTFVGLFSPITPATGTTAVPDEQAGVAPRKLTWKETRISFRQADNTVLAQFWLRDIVGWSDTAPNTP